MARSTATAAARSAPGRRAPSASDRRRPRGRSVPRRRSGPGPAGAAVALPARVLDAPFARAARARTGGVLDALLQGRAWIALLAVLLVGIVFFNVDLLELNRNIAHTSERAAGLKRVNAGLRLQLARLASSERIQRVAARRGLELPAPGDVRYLRLRPRLDARNAAARIAEPGSGAATPVPSSTPPVPQPATSRSPPAPAAPASGTPSTQATGGAPSSPPAATPPTTSAPASSPGGGTGPPAAAPGG